MKFSYSTVEFELPVNDELRRLLKDPGYVVRIEASFSGSIYPGNREEPADSEMVWGDVFAYCNTLGPVDLSMLSLNQETEDMITDAMWDHVSKDEGGQE